MAIDLKPIYEEAKANAPHGDITIAKSASNREKFVQFYKSLLKRDEEKEQPDAGGMPTLAEMAAPGREPQVRKLKKLIKKGKKKGGIPKTFKKGGKTKKSNPFAISRAQYNKTKEEAKGGKEDEPEEEPKDPNEPDQDGPLAGNEILPGKKPGETSAGVASEPQPSPESPEIGVNKAQKTSETGHAVPGEVPPEPKTEPELYQPDTEIFETAYKNVKVGNYQLELRRRVEPNGSVVAEMLFWESEGRDKETKGAVAPKFHSSVIMVFPDKTSFKDYVEHWRWQLGQFLNDIKSRPE